MHCTSAWQGHATTRTNTTTTTPMSKMLLWWCLLLFLPRLIAGSANSTFTNERFRLFNTSSSSYYEGEEPFPSAFVNEQPSPVNDINNNTNNHSGEDFATVPFLSTSNIAVMAIAAMLLFLLAPGSGMSVGGILVPLFSQCIFLLSSPLPTTTTHLESLVFFMQQSKQNAVVALSNMTLAGSAAASCLAMIMLSSSHRNRQRRSHQRHNHNHRRRRRREHDPHYQLLERQRPVVDWDWIGLVEPMTLAGVVIGTRLTRIVADAFLRGTIILVYTVLAASMLQRAVTAYYQNYNKTTFQQDHHGWVPVATTEDGVEMAAGSIHRHRQQHNQSQQIIMETRDTMLSPIDDDDDDDTHFDAHDLVTHRIKNRLMEQILEQEKIPNARSILSVVCLFGLVLLVNITIKGHSNALAPEDMATTGMPCESLTFWFADAFIILVAVLLTLQARNRLLDLAQRKHLAGYPYLETDIQWDEQSTVVYPAICTLGGIMAALCGVGGGGMIKAPLMLALGVPPAVAAATSTTMLLFTSVTASVSFFWNHGMQILDYAVVYFLIGLVATYMGHVIFMQKNNISSSSPSSSAYIVYCIAIVVVLTAISLGIEWIMNVQQGEQSLPFQYYYNLCTNLT